MRPFIKRLKFFGENFSETVTPNNGVSLLKILSGLSTSSKRRGRADALPPYLKTPIR